MKSQDKLYNNLNELNEQYPMESTIPLERYGFGILTDFLSYIILAIEQFIYNQLDPFQIRGTIIVFGLKCKLSSC